MEVKKSEPINQTTETNQSEPTSPQTPDNRQLGLPFRLLLHISMPISVPIYARLFACLCSRIPTK